MTEPVAPPKRRHRSKVELAQPPRGILPGKRGPNKTPEEREQERQRKLEAYRTKRKDVIAPGAVMKIGGSRSPEARELQELIQDIGAEEIDPVKGWTRIQVVVRKLYLEAAQGKISAMELLFNRGWGRVPMPVKMSIQAQLSEALDQSGLTREEANEDPLLRFLLNSGDMVVENNHDSIERSDAVIEPSDARSQAGAGEAPGAGFEGFQEPD